MAMFDDMFDEFPLHHSLRIPPLIDPLPFLSASLDRPSPLEPNARVNAKIDNETAKLTGRRKALAEAKSLGDTESSDLRPLQKTSRNDLRPIQKSPRKREKLYDHEQIADFVQLPQPKAKAKEEKLPPFQPISILNELHEPPPSAALFPPITPGATLDAQGWKATTEVPRRDFDTANSTPVKKTTTKDGKDDKPAPKRVRHRPQRLRWSEAEINQLVKGVAIYGMGKWKKILTHPDLTFQEGRTSVDLKDRFRTCFPQRVSDKHRTFANELLAHPYDSSDFPPSNPPAPPSPRKPRKPKASRSPGPNRKRARRTPWSQEEDDALREGYHLHGFQWTLIAKDPSLSLANRSGNQVRDRFRLKYAHLYGGEGAPCQAASMPAEGNMDSHLQSRNGRDKSKKQSNDRDNDNSNRAFTNDSGCESANANDEDYHDHEPPSPKRLTATSKPAAPAPFDISNILNYEDQASRPSTSFRYDGWSENVTLPPLLLWEDMATRPMFELE